MVFYRFGEMTIDEAEIIAKDLGLKNGDPYEQVLVTTNGCRFELEDEHSLYVEKLDAKIWIDVLYGDTDNYRSNVFYWNDIYGNQIPENAIIIGDTQNNGFIVYIHSGLEKGIYYWDDSYAFDCSNKDCNAYLIADDIKSLFENLKITYRKLFARIKKCKPNIEFGEDNMLYRATGSEKIQTIDAKECKDITHKCNEFKIKFEFTRQYDIEVIVLQSIKRVEDGTGYVFPKGIRNLIFDTSVKNIKRTCFGVFDDIVNTSFDIIEFADFSLERNAWNVNCSGEDVDYAIEKGDFERARKLQELHKYYVVFAYCEEAVNDYYAIEKSTNKIVAFNWNDLKIEKVADNFESFVNSFYNKDERSMQKADAQKADIQAIELDDNETIESKNPIDEFEQLRRCKSPVSFKECIIKNTRTILEMMEKTGYAMLIDIDTVEPDEQLDVIINCCLFFDENREEIQKILGIPLDVIMYSWYYWGEVFLATLGVKGKDDYGDHDSVVDYIFRIPEYIECSGLEDLDFDFMDTLSDEVNEMTKGGLEAYYNRRDK